MLKVYRLFVYFDYFVYFAYVIEDNRRMSSIKNARIPSREEQDFALRSYPIISKSLKGNKGNYAVISLGGVKEELRIPRSSMSFLVDCLKATSEGKSFSVVALDRELTTQKAADYLGCSRPHLVKLLEEGVIPFTKVGKHRRVSLNDIQAYAGKRQEERIDYLKKSIKEAKEQGLYGEQ